MQSKSHNGNARSTGVPSKGWIGTAASRSARAGAVLLILSGLLQAGAARAEDGVIEINQAAALAGGVTPGDARGFPVTLGQSGRYRLTGNLTVPDVDTTAIDVTATEVDIDLNGFAIVGPVTCAGTPPVCSGTGTGHGIDGTTVTVVRNGVIRGVGGNGVVVGGGGRVENMIIAEVGGDGIVLGGFGSTARRNVVALCNDHGIVDSAPFESIVAQNVVRQCGGFGLELVGVNTTYSENVLRDNNGGSFAVQVNGGANMRRNLCNTSPCP